MLLDVSGPEYFQLACPVCLYGKELYHTTLYRKYDLNPDSNCFEPNGALACEPRGNGMAIPCWPENAITFSFLSLLMESCLKHLAMALS